MHMSAAVNKINCIAGSFGAAKGADIAAIRVVIAAATRAIGG